MVDECKIGDSVIRLVKENIIDVDAEALVYYARGDLALGSGFGSAISQRGGPSIQKELSELAPIGIGESVITSAGNLKAKYIIHTVGPKFMEEDMEDKLLTAMSSALKRAEEKEIKSIVFPPMGAGFYGIPLELCCNVMIESIKKHLEGETCIEVVVICLLDSREYEVFKKGLEALN